MEKKIEFSQEKPADIARSLITQVDRLLVEEQEAGRGKLGKNIKEITNGPYRDAFFVDGGIIYLPPKGKVVFIGDTHGDSKSTQAILKQIDFDHRVQREPDFRLVFLGDYADRGNADVKNLLLVLSLKQQYPREVILMRGNHEDNNVSPCNLPNSLFLAYGTEGRELYLTCLSLFDKLPSVLLCGNGIVAVHGGIPSEDIRNLFDLKDNKKLFDQIRWNDPTRIISDRMSSKRGGWDLTEFGISVFNKFMKATEGSIMVRSHQAISGEGAFLFDNRLLTIFSTGRDSNETGYSYFSSPIFAEFDLSKPITKISQENIRKIKY